MLVLAIQRSNRDEHPGLVDAMFCLRARVFSERLGWKVNVTNGREIDEFDELSPTYIIALSDAGAVAGCARLLPATGPTMLEQTFPQLLPTGRLKAHSGMIESSRFCVDTTIAAGRAGKRLLHNATSSMFAGIINWSMANNFTEIVTATDLRFERILARADWPMKRIGDPRRIGVTDAVAGLLPADTASFARVCPSDYRSVFKTNCRKAA